MDTYRGWQLFEQMPKAYKFDNTVGSPLYGYNFATTGVSILNGGKRVLVRVFCKTN